MALGPNTLFADELLSKQPAPACSRLTVDIWIRIEFQTNKITMMVQTQTILDSCRNFPIHLFFYREAT